MNLNEHPYVYLTLLQMVTLILARKGFKKHFLISYNDNPETPYKVEEKIQYDEETITISTENTNNLNEMFASEKNNWESQEKEAAKYVEHDYSLAYNTPKKAKQITAAIIKLNRPARERLINAIFTQIKYDLNKEIRKINHETEKSATPF